MGLLSTPEEKEILLKRYGMDEVEVVLFDKKISKLPAFLFLREELIKKRNARGIVVGNDFRFGVGRSAGALELVR
jgi:riboflavin kinase/FMN adenylyltransferase